MIRHLVKEYDGKWEINKWSALPNRGAYYVTPVITPIKSDNVRLFFELKWDFFQSLFNSGPAISCLELRVFRESMSGGKPSELEASFAIRYSDGRLLRECRNPFPININSLYNCCFDRTRFEVLMPDKNSTLYYTNHCRRLRSNNLTLTCHLKFYDHAPPKEIVLLRELQKFMRNMCIMYESNIMTDFVFKVEDKSLHAHKVILSAHSSVLEKMVSSNFLESKTNSAEITDCTYETFNSFLRYLYSAEVITPAWQNVLELYILADKYDIEVLKEKCADTLIDTLNVDRLSQILKFAYLYRDSRLIQAAKKFCANLPD